MSKAEEVVSDGSCKMSANVPKKTKTKPNNHHCFALVQT